jgi:hypothetical protein
MQKQHQNNASLKYFDNSIPYSQDDDPCRCYNKLSPKAMSSLCMYSGGAYS